MADDRSTKAALKLVAIGDIDPHPDNPRVVLREDVINAIVANLNGEFPRKHAVHLRPIGKRHQLLAGHQRVEAARRKGLASVWAWVEEMDDAAAFMELVTSNNQGELSPLEIGIHALKAVPKEQGKKGGGLKAYAEKVGRSTGYITQVRQAGEVVSSLRGSDLFSQLNKFLDRAQHLCAIHALPAACWPDACAWLASASDATVKDVDERVKHALEYGHQNAVHKDWLDVFPKHRCMSAVFQGTSPAEFHRLYDIALKAFEGLSDDLADEWRRWLVENVGGDSWDARKARAKRDELEDTAWQREQAGLSADDRFTVHACDFRKATIESASIDAIITDPPYPEEFIDLYGDLSEFAARVLKPGGSLFVMCGQSYLDRVFPLLCKHLTYHWTFTYLTPGGQAVQCWDRKVNTFWKPVFWFTKGEYAGEWVGDVCKSAVNDNDKDHHHWGQSESGMADLIDRVTRPGHVVCDPFLGGGTTGVIAVRMGRPFVGAELDPDVAEQARTRISEEAKGIAGREAK